MPAGVGSGDIAQNYLLEASSQASAEAEGVYYIRHGNELRPVRSQGSNGKPVREELKGGFR